MISRRAGFTTIELMITVAIIAILAAISAPSMRDMVKNARMTSLVNDLMTDLSVARAEAVKRGVRATVCTSNTGTGCTATAWGQGWIIFIESNTTGAFGTVDAGEQILKIAPVINGANENPPTLITASTGGAAINFVNFRPTGVLTPGGGGAVTTDFFLCDSRRTDLGVSASEALGKGRHIVVLGTGRAQQNRCTCNSATACTP